MLCEGFTHHSPKPMSFLVGKFLVDFASNYFMKRKSRKKKVFFQNKLCFYQQKKNTTFAQKSKI
jgi:hypothetical protein